MTDCQFCIQQGPDIASAEYADLLASTQERYAGYDDMLAGVGGTHQGFIEGFTARNITRNGCEYRVGYYWAIPQYLDQYGILRNSDYHKLISAIYVWLWGTTANACGNGGGPWISGTPPGEPPDPGTGDEDDICECDVMGDIRAVNRVQRAMRRALGR